MARKQRVFRGKLVTIGGHRFIVAPAPKNVRNPKRTKKRKATKKRATRKTNRKRKGSKRKK